MIFLVDFQSVHLLHQPEFNPHVVFVSAPKFDIAKAMMDYGIRENLTVNKRTVGLILMKNFNLAI